MSTPGVPDIIGCFKGRMIGIEIKSEKGVVSEYQKEFIENINRAGGLAFVARSLEDVIEGLGLQDRFLLR
jgi:penicillin-binding protein-related factor A (putative recombinase)